MQWNDVTLRLIHVNRVNSGTGSLLQRARPSWFRRVGDTPARVSDPWIQECSAAYSRDEALCG